MKKQCAFTICAKNYLGLAVVLKKSLLQYYDIEFHIFIADEIEEDLLDDKIHRCRTTLSIHENRWWQNAFKYDVTEFCTYLKPYCFDFLQRFYEEICYFDPDILFFSSADVIFKEFETHDFLVTPHLLEIKEKQGDYYEVEDELRVSGQFNFGFIGIKNSDNGKKFIAWWKNRLDNKCYRDPVSHQFTDQCWGNYLVSYFDIEKIKVFRNKGMNLAPWNFDERRVLKSNNSYVIANRYNTDETKDMLVFVHYSGFNYMELLNGKIEQFNEGHQAYYPDLKEIFNEYEKNLILNSDMIIKYIKNNYSYNSFDNGKKISLLNRRLYRAILLQGDDIGNPFESENKKFYKILEKKGLIVTKSSKEYSSQVIWSKKNIELFTILCAIFRLLRRVLGNDAYFNLIDVLKCLGLKENQIHLFDKKRTWLWWQKVKIFVRK